jgi:hypothetical protein
MELINNAPPDSIRTHSGLYVNVFEPTPAMISIEDIAHALAHQCRFSGHLQKFYSVAQHSVLVASLVSEEKKFDGLMHDASEAYLLDIPTPIKAKLPNYKLLESDLMKIIANKFGFRFPFDAEVKRADAEMLQREWHALMIGDNIGFDIIPLSPSKAKLAFLKCFHQYKPQEYLVNV